jgi:hypothetical protein
VFQSANDLISESLQLLPLTTIVAVCDRCLKVRTGASALFSARMPLAVVDKVKYDNIFRGLPVSHRRFQFR